MLLINRRSVGWWWRAAKCELLWIVSWTAGFIWLRCRQRWPWHGLSISQDLSR